MVLVIFIGTICLFMVAFTFDISFNLRRLNNNMDRLWRRLIEIEDTVQKK